MPELPEVETIKNALSKAVCGARIRHIDVLCKRFRESVPEDLPQKTVGALILACRRIAKYMLVDLDNGFSLIWHLGMSGRVKICTDESISLQKHDHIIITTDKNTIIFNDARRFGIFTYSRTTDLKKHHLLNRIGLDPFDNAVDGNFLFEKFKNKTVAVKIALLDQQIISGIGNIYASEALYAARILPTRKAYTLTRIECQCLCESIRCVLRKAIDAGGSTLKDYRQPDGTMGYFQNEHCVYNKTGQRCPDCRCNILKTGGIRKSILGGRSTFYCETLQK